MRELLTEIAALSDKVIARFDGQDTRRRAFHITRAGADMGIRFDAIPILDTLGIKNYISVLDTQGPQFAAALEAHARTYGVDIMNGQRVAALDPAATPGGPTKLTLDNGAVLQGDGQKVDCLMFKNRADGSQHRVALAGVFVQIGLVPNTEFLKGVVELSKYGEIIVDDRGATSVPGVFAAGDETTVPFKQIIIAAGDGAKAALAAFDHLIRA